MKKVIILLMFALPLPLLASHYMGGEITWQCLGNGRYRFIMKLYRECNGINYGDIETLQSNSPAGSIQMNLSPGSNPRDIEDGLLDGKTDISPKCWDPAQQLHCYPVPPTPNTGAVQEWYFTSDSAYPSGIPINGVPPANGWVFSHTSCCRNPSTSIANGASTSWFLRSIMYPNNTMNAYPCYDSAPVFAEPPTVAVCYGLPHNLVNVTEDVEGDSLTFSWASALDGNLSTPVTYMTGYSYNHPLPGTAQNINNIPAVLDSLNGNLSLTSYTSGAFPVVIKVTEYRDQIKIAEIFREFQLVILACPGDNHNPEMIPPVYNPLTGIYDLWMDTVTLGVNINLNISVLDLDTLPGGNGQVLNFFASGDDFGTGYSNPLSGCPNPPCATMNPPPPIVSYVATAPQFHWATDCSQVTYWLNANQYYWCDPYYYFPKKFLFWVHDDFCPVPGYNSRTLDIVLRTLPLVAHPVLKCADADPSGGIIISWEVPPDTTSHFYSYQIFRSPSVNGNYQLIHTIYDINQAVYHDITASTGPGMEYYYKIKTISGCNGNLPRPGFSNIISAYYIGHPVLLCAETDADGNVILEWEPPPGPKANFFAYQIFRSNSYSGIYQHMHDVFDSAQTQFINYGVNPGAAYMYYYKMRTTSGCAGGTHLPGYSDVVSTTQLDLNVSPGNSVLLSWTLNGTLTANPPWYGVYMNCDGLNWMLLASTWQNSYILDNPGGMYDDCQFMVQAVDENGCRHSSIPGFYAQDEEHPSGSNCIEIYPNPAYADLHIEFSELCDLRRLDVFDVYGRSHSLRVIMERAPSSVVVDVSRLPQGLYYLKVPGCAHVQKFLVMR